MKQIKTSTFAGGDVSETTTIITEEAYLEIGRKAERLKDHGAEVTFDTLEDGTTKITRILHAIEATDNITIVYTFSEEE